MDVAEGFAVGGEAWADCAAYPAADVGGGFRGEEFEDVEDCVEGYGL